MRIVEVHRGSAVATHGCRRHLPALGIQQLQVGMPSAFQTDFHTQGTVLVAGIQIGNDADILDALLIAGVQVTVAPYAAVTEKSWSSRYVPSHQRNTWKAIRFFFPGFR